MTDIESTTEEVNTENSTQSQTPTVLFKKQTKSRNIRKRDISTTILEDNSISASQSGDSPQHTDHTNHQSTDDQLENNNSSSGSSSSNNVQVEKKQKHIVNQYTTKGEKRAEYTYESSGSAKPMFSEADTSTTLIEREDDGDDKNNNETVNNDDGIYRGMKSYNNYTEKKSDLTYKGAGVKAGPIKITTSNYKSSVRFDYQPDVCKDYKQTGQCSFGDTCKFLHDRSDYKAGWQVEREYEAEQRQKKKEKESLNERGFKDNEDDDLPFACLICRKPFDNPVMTKCKHFFCEQCALDHNRKSKKCFLCKEPTNGAFSQPKKIIDKLIAKTKLMSELNKSIDQNE